MGTVNQFNALLLAKGSNATVMRQGIIGICPCVTPEGFRDPKFHLQLPLNSAHIVASAGGTIPGADNVLVAMELRSAAGVSCSPRIILGTYNLDGHTNFKLTFSNITKPNPPHNSVEWIFVYSLDGTNFKLLAEWAFNDDQPFDVTSLPNGAVLPDPILCNEAGEIKDPNNVGTLVKAFVQPIQSTRATRLNTEILVQMFGEVESDDHLGIFPCVWGGDSLSFDNWSTAGDEYIEYDGRRYTIVNANKIPDPDDGNPSHHWELGLRLISDEAPIG